MKPTKCAYNEEWSLQLDHLTKIGHTCIIKYMYIRSIFLIRAIKMIIDLGFVVILSYPADPAAQVYSYRSVCIKSEAEQLYHHIPQYLRLPSCFMKLNLSRYSWGAFSGWGDIPLCTAWWGRYKKNGYKKVICRYNVVIVFAKHNSLSHTVLSGLYNPPRDWSQWIA